MNFTAKLRSFEATDKTDVVLVVEDEKFHVEKKFLAEKSEFFRGLLLGSCKESRQSEVAINGFDPSDFRKFLEILHEERILTDENVGMILEMNDHFASDSVARSCFVFILNSANIKVLAESEKITNFMVSF
ncbi:hypothetical protein B9Z55_026682 [Caenorhabditis nigoni]|uniref:BTB domain-containing protein n=1 Tax=Caenorhabditis nigoni TaxID=1611254 RepID=A0A2G5T4D1_9PELO|nr:hypothetical protein B9Z55_026682 [Caenorhabditis nigoni]